ncbi:hypothetical protein H8N00_02630 [Streptomyces sp. AC563]|uniref:deoxynucleotide monophosphate kinase family protein n=1 Tax=Streptomyces buecherae TaxID=2763006 RepID=UPI00164EBF72|nr:hypothetical protein [Streptomyces buecherae]MBC3987820.1 hypothetical protein [Streptomyces buecherae]
MTYRHVALIGRAGAGKDTVGARLVHRFAFVRVAFADPLRAMALDVNPIIDTEPASDSLRAPLRLSDLVRSEGWDAAKQRSEVRRTLQRLGQAVRDQDPDYWLRLALARIDVADRWGLPVVVTDARHINEAEALRARGFLLVRIVRPGTAGQADATARRHISERELRGFDADAVLTNGARLADLHALADRLAVPR